MPTPRPEPDAPLAVEVAHSVPFMAGNGSLVAVPLTTRATITPFGPGEAAYRPIPSGSGRTAILRVSGRRLWAPVGTKRFVPGRTGRNAPALSGALSALSDPEGPHACLRRQLRRLPLDPHELVGFWGKEEAVRKPRQVLRDMAPDLQGQATASLVRVMGADLRHDGERLWIAVPPPMLTWAHSSEPPIDLGERHAVRDDVYPCVGPLDPDDVRSFAAAFADAGLGGREADRLLASARTLSAQYGHLAPDPMLDVQRFVAQQSQRMRWAAAALVRSRRGAAVREDPEAVAAIRANLPAAVASTVGLGTAVDPHEASMAVIRLARALLRFAPGERIDGPAAELPTFARLAVSYGERIVVPRLAAIPIPEADAQDIGMLAP